MLTQWFDPEPGPAAIPGVLAREMVRQSHDVKVLTGFPNYPTGLLYDGYWQSIRRTRWSDGVEITRVPLVTGHSKSALERVVNYGTFALSASLAGAGVMRQVDAMWVYNSPVTVGLPMLLHSRFGRTPIFYHVQDLWPESVTQSGMIPSGVAGCTIERSIEFIVKFLERRASVIGVISPSVKEIILERNPHLDESRIIYAPNPTDEGLFRPLCPARQHYASRPRDGFTLMYAGAIGAAQGLETAIDAVAAAGRIAPIDLVVVGDGNARADLERQVEDLGARNIFFLGRVAKSAMPSLMRRADAQLVSLADEEYLRYTTPSKISSLLSAEVPIVGVLAGDGAKLLKQSGAAIVTEPGDVGSLTDELIKLAFYSEDALARMGQRGGAFYRDQMSAERVVNEIVSAINAL